MAYKAVIGLEFHCEMTSHTKVVSKAINGFSTVYESLGSNTISTEWLTRLEREHSFFPWTNYKVFAKKK